MADVWIEPRAEALDGMIQRKYAANSRERAELELAYYSIVVELRRAHPSIWLLRADDEHEVFVLYHPPLKAFFRRIHEGQIGIVRFVEINP